ncbi:MAG: hypothetical protein FJ109_11510, partial [Deltaproteobacteria bacterium]|nr:hypothetical protein [Deltaproteobacteria bacterium]
MKALRRLRVLLVLLCSGCGGGSTVGIDAQMEVRGPLDGRTGAQDACVPQCAGLECGEDGCGGQCGNCDDGELCTVDSCIDGTCAHDVESFCCLIDGLPYPEGIKWPDEFCLACLPEVDATAWVPVPDGSTCPEGICFQGGCCPHADNCQGKECGDDGCGGVCGECPGVTVCVEGTCCATTCDMQGAQCGDDGCGTGECGACPEWTACGPGGFCETGCHGCGDQMCGNDDCGEQCGTCPKSSTCLPDGSACVKYPNPCAGFECGTVWLGKSCGECAKGQWCIQGHCTDECTPDCALRECGDDGCGGSCGKCGPAVPCTMGGLCGGTYAECSDAQPDVFSMTFAEGNLSNWAASLGARVVHTFPDIPEAPTGGHVLVLGTDMFSPLGPDVTTLANTIVCLGPGQWTVIVDWRFYSDEFKEWCGSVHQDGGLVSLTRVDTSETSTVLDVTIDDLCPASQCQNCGTMPVKLSQMGDKEGSFYWTEGDVWGTPWLSTAVALTVEQPASYRLLGEAFSVVGADYPSWLIIDRIRFVKGACVPDCVGKECGPDGCGGTCAPNVCQFGHCGGDGLCKCTFVECEGSCCPQGGVCDYGVCCKPYCKPSWECGLDGCSGSCGECAQSWICIEHVCYPEDCWPQCDGKECGEDKCGGTCGECGPGTTCSEGLCDCNMPGSKDLKWETYLGEGGNDGLGAAVPHPANGVLVAGNEGKKLMLARLDGQGKTVWSSSYSLPGAVQARDLAVLADGSIVAVGHEEFDNGTACKRVLVKASSGGTLEYTHAPTSAEGCAEFRGVAVVGQGVVAAGYVTFQGKPRALVERFDPVDAPPVWSVQLDSAVQSGRGVDVAAAGDGAAVLRMHPSGTDKGWRLTRLDGQGSVLWEADIPGPPLEPAGAVVPLGGAFLVAVSTGEALSVDSIP